MVTEGAHYWERLGFFGGHVFLDFLNTVNDIGKSRKLEAIESWDALLRWALATKVINQSEARSLERSYPGEVTRSELTKLHSFREMAWQILSAIAADRDPRPETLSGLSREVRSAYAQAALTFENEGLSWNIMAAAPSVTLIRARLGLAADNLLAQRPLKVVECGSCTGLFINQGRGVGRKWCRMQSCGNRAKVTKFRAR